MLNALADNGEVSGTSGMLLAFCMLIAGIVGVATRKSKGGGIVAGVFYLLGGLLGIVNYGSFSDLAIWSVLCFIFGAVFILGSLKMKKADKTDGIGTARAKAAVRLILSWSFTAKVFLKPLKC